MLVSILFEVCLEFDCGFQRANQGTGSSFNPLRGLSRVRLAWCMECLGDTSVSILFEVCLEFDDQPVNNALAPLLVSILFEVCLEFDQNGKLHGVFYRQSFNPLRGLSRVRRTKLRLIGVKKFSFNPLRGLSRVRLDAEQGLMQCQHGFQSSSRFVSSSTIRNRSVNVGEAKVSILFEVCLEFDTWQ